MIEKVTTKHEKCRTAAPGGFHAGEGAGATFSFEVKGKRRGKFLEGPGLQIPGSLLHNFGGQVFRLRGRFRLGAAAPETRRRFFLAARPSPGRGLGGFGKV